MILSIVGALLTGLVQFIAALGAILLWPLKQLYRFLVWLDVFHIREKSKGPRRVTLAFVFIVLFIGLWAQATSPLEPLEARKFNRINLPHPVDVVKSFTFLHYESDLNRNIFKSLYRVTAGFIIAVCLAVPLGIFMGSFTKIREFFNPLATMGGYLPIVTLQPLVFAFFMIGTKATLAFITIAIFVMLLPLVVQAIDKVANTYLQTGYTLGATKWQTVWYVLIPVAKADIFKALDLTYGIGWGYLIFAELMGGGELGGLGSLMYSLNKRAMTEPVYGVMIVIVILSFIINAVWKYLGKALFPYQSATES